MLKKPLDTGCFSDGTGTYNLLKKNSFQFLKQLVSEEEKLSQTHLLASLQLHWPKVSSFCSWRGGKFCQVHAFYSQQTSGSCLSKIKLPIFRGLAINYLVFLLRPTNQTLHIKTASCFRLNHMNDQRKTALHPLSCLSKNM